MKQIKPVRALCESAVLLALGIVLSYVKFAQLPFEGAITLASMLPICLISIRFGIKWGLGAAFCYSWSQILQGGVFSWGLTPGMLIASLLLDYIVAFSVLGLAGLFRRHGVWGKVGGITLACFLRFVAFVFEEKSHFVYTFDYFMIHFFFILKLNFRRKRRLYGEGKNVVLSFFDFMFKRMCKP